MEEFLDNIMALLNELLPSDWEKTVLHMRTGEKMFSMYFFVKSEGNSSFYSYYDLECLGFFSEQEFMDIAYLMGKESLRYREEQKAEWTGFTLVVYCDGLFQIYYEFDEQPLIIEQEWKTKYLN